MTTLAAPRRSASAVFRRPLASPLFREIGIIVLVLVTLEFVVYRSYFSGSVIPQFDFMGGYNEEAYAWWAQGSLFDPPQWMSTMWGGYPAVSNLQNSSFYLPVGIMSALTPFTPHASAVLSALHVTFGAVGVYVFCRAWGTGKRASLVGMVAWFFAAGFISNATELDIMRAYAWLPWIMIISSAKWPWRKWWAVLIAVVFLWQAVLAIYPGMLVALAYCIPLWIIANQVFFRPKIRNYLLPAAIVGGSAALMSLIRFWPALAARGTYPNTLADTSTFPTSMIGTFLFSFDNPRLPGISIMNSYMVPAMGLALLVFTPFADRLVQALIVPAVASILLSAPFWPWHDALTAHLPGFDLSRFRASDFKFVLLFALCIFGVRSTDRLLSRTVPRPRGIALVIPLIALGIGVVGFAAVALHADFTSGFDVALWILLALSAVYVALLASGKLPGGRRFAIAGILVGVALSGTVGAYSVSDAWRSDRVAVEQSYLGQSVSSLIDQRPTDRITRQMPARIAPPANPTGDVSVDTHYGRAFYTGQASVFGYVNLRGTQTFELIKADIYAPGVVGEYLRDFWSSAGLLLEAPTDAIPRPQQIAACASGKNCGVDLKVTPVSYNPNGNFRINVTAAKTTPVVMNVAGYDGWQAKACKIGSATTCTPLPVTQGKVGELAFTVPAGTWQLNVDYRLPNLTKSWIAFCAGSFATLALSAVLLVTGRRRRSSNGDSMTEQPSNHDSSSPVIVDSLGAPLPSEGDARPVE